MITQSQHYDALVLSLMLAISAPTNAKAKHCVEMAEVWTAGMTLLEVESAKSEALIRLETFDYPVLKSPNHLTH